MEQLKKISALLLATGVVWLSVALVVLIDLGEFVNGAAAVMALVATMTIWSLWALDAYGISIDGTSHAREKAKREASTDEDARLALLLALLTPDERDAVRARLAADLDADGELPLADLLAGQDQAAASAQHDR